MDSRCFDPTKAPLFSPLPGNLTAHIELGTGQSADASGKEPIEITEDLGKANVILSKMDDESGQHRPVLDFDFPARLLPSSTEGHFHLLIDKPMSWEVYSALLVAMKDAGLLEEGYVNAALRRGYTAVRLPWIKKPKPEPEPVLPSDPEDPFA